MGFWENIFFIFNCLFLFIYSTLICIDSYFYWATSAVSCHLSFFPHPTEMAAFLSSFLARTLINISDSCTVFHMTSSECGLPVSISSPSLTFRHRPFLSTLPNPVINFSILSTGFPGFLFRYSHCFHNLFFILFMFPIRTSWQALCR